MITVIMDLRPEQYNQKMAIIRDEMAHEDPVILDFFLDDIITAVEDIIKQYSHIDKLEVSGHAGFIKPYIKLLKETFSDISVMSFDEAIQNYNYRIY